MKAYRGSRSIAPSMLSLSTKWRRLASLTSWPFYPRDRTPALIKLEARWALKSVLTVLEERKPTVPARIQTSDPSAISSGINRRGFWQQLPNVCRQQAGPSRCVQVMALGKSHCLANLV